MTEIWAVAHPAHPTTYRDTKQQALALVDAWTTERSAAVCWPMTVEDAAVCPECGHAAHMAGWCVYDSHPACDCNADDGDMFPAMTPDRPSAKEQP